MDRCHKSLKQDLHSYKSHIENPSFSSSLLDAIYRSIDEGEEELILYRETMRKKRGNCIGGTRADDDDLRSHQRACMMEKRTEKKVSEKVVVRRKSVPEKVRSDRGSMFPKSSSSSSDSTSYGGFSSSEAESLYGLSSNRPKPIRTSVSVHPEKFNHHGVREIHDEKNHSSHQKPKHESGFVKTKSKAMKIYGDLKKVKQPISPGGRLASFLNSLFTPGSTKKAKVSSCIGEHDDTSSDNRSKLAHGSTCSSASSFSRSCLSKTPTSKLSNGAKRSVRFYPVSVIVGEDCQPCGHKSLYKDDQPSVEVMSGTRNSINEDLKFRAMEKNRRVEEAARDLLKNYQKKVEYEFDVMNVEEIDDEDEDEDDGASSDASSDLFELDNLSAIGIERYREELPVYETTRFDTNRAIANGFIIS